MPAGPSPAFPVGPEVQVLQGFVPLFQHNMRSCAASFGARTPKRDKMGLVENMAPMADPGNRDIETTTLRNGVRVITERMAHVRSVSLGVWITTGSRCETPDENGISHFIEHMVFKGTTNRTA